MTNIVQPLLRLDQWIIKMIEDKQVDTIEFQAALRFYGREKLEKIWRKHLEESKPEL